MKHLPPERADEQQELSSERLLRDDTKFASGKIAAVQYISVAVFLFLLFGFWSLQVQNQQEYAEMAERNSIKSYPLLAPRGKILDRDGRVIVDNHSSFSLLLSRDSLKLEHLKPIADGVGLDYDELLARVRRFQSRPTYQPIIIKEELTPDDIAFVESHRDPQTFPEMELLHAQRRIYPTGGLAAHAIGYVGEISETELNMAEYAKYDQGDVIGKAGLERQYNELLMGVDGRRQVIVDNMGHERKLLGMKPAVPGQSLQLTIDLDLQVVAELAMENRRGAVVALDPRTGEVLAMVSRPAYDPSKFAGRISTMDWKEINDNPDKPLLNRAIQAQLAPGSTFKPVMSIAGLETGYIEPGTRVSCAGGASFYGSYHKCWNKKGHGTVDMHRALVNSCDVFYYTIGDRMGIDRIAQYAEAMGFGKKTGIDLPQEKSGIVPSTKWKMRNYRQKWYAGETVSVAIGQGALTVTPLQLAHAIGGLVSGGVWHRPHLVKSADAGERPVKVDWNLDHINQVIYGMWGVVNEGGTGAIARIANFDVCGKTGTAQLASNDFLKNTARGREMVDNAWFIGFAPKQAPEIVVVALFESGAHGDRAAPIVRDVIKAYYDKQYRSGKQQPPKLAFAKPGDAPAATIAMERPH